MSLLSATLIKPNESLPGFLMRATEDCHFDRMSWITDMMDINIYQKGKLISLASYADVLSNYFTDSELAFKTHGYTPAGGPNGPIFGFGDQQFSRSLLNTNTTRLCPECLKCDGIHRQVWELALYTCCPQHQCELLDRCPDCNKQLNWYAGRLTVCEDCGCDFCSVKTPPVSSSVQQLALAIETAALNKTPPGTQRDDHQNLTEIHNVICFIGWSAGRFSEKDNRSLSSTSFKELQNLTKFSANILYSNWPESWYPILDKYKEKRTQFSYGDYNFNTFFGPLNEHLNAPENETTFAKLKEGFKTYLIDRKLNLGISKRGGSRIGETINQGQAVTSELAKTILGANNYKWLEKLKIINITTTLNGGYILHMLPSSDVTKAKQFLANVINSGEAAKRLKISVPTIQKLLEDKTLIAIRGPNVDGARNWRIHLDEIKKLIDGLDVKSVYSSDENLIDLITSLALAKPKKKTLSNLLAEIANERIQPYKTSNQIRNLKDIYFLKKDILKFSQN